MSHPPDTIVSKLNKDPNAKLVEVAKNLGLIGELYATVLFTYNLTISLGRNIYDCIRM